MGILSNSRHERFCQAIVAGKSGKDAYVEAGYSANGHAAESAAARLLRNVEVSARIAELNARVTEGVVLSRQWVIERLMENANRAMQAVEVTSPDGNGTGEYRYEGSVANRALELLGKEIGMFVDRKEVGKPGEFDQMTDAELREFVASRTARNGAGIARIGIAGGNGTARGKPH